MISQESHDMPELVTRLDLDTGGIPPLTRQDPGHCLSSEKMHVTPPTEEDCYLQTLLTKESSPSYDYYRNFCQPYKHKRDIYAHK